jgi:sialic acid synthase SpsE
MTGKLTIIAEAGVNHNGSLDRAIEMVDVAAAAGADIIKFQTFSADKLARKDAQLADYQKTSDGDQRSQWDLLKGLELSHDEFLAVKRRCDEKGIVFLSTGFDIDELHFLVDELSIPLVKIASGDLTFAAMLFEAGLTGLPIVLSTGMADLDEIGTALGIIAVGYGVHAGLLAADSVPRRAVAATAQQDVGIRAILRDRVTILHCTTEYPAPPEVLNLRAIRTIADAYGLPVGYSDHSLGALAATIAVSLGATVIEKHFTLDKELEGPDHSASLDPEELAGFIAQLRQVEVELGSDVKACQPVEVSNRAAVRRSLVARESIREGERITVKAVDSQRPASGRTAFDYWDVVGTVATRGYEPGDYLD